MQRHILFRYFLFRSYVLRNIFPPSNIFCATTDKSKGHKRLLVTCSKNILFTADLQLDFTKKKFSSTMEPHSTRGKNHCRFHRCLFTSVKNRIFERPFYVTAINCIQKSTRNIAIAFSGFLKITI